MIAASSDIGRLLRYRPFQLYFWARGLSEFAGQMAVVTVAWQLYALTDSAFALGMIGLAQFVPTALLIFIAGHVSDRYERKRVLQICQFAEGATAAFLAVGTFGGWLNASEIFAAVLILGTATAFESPADAALLPAVAPEGLRQKATAFATAAFQAAMVGGPALGGIVYGLSPGASYAAIAVFWLLAAILNGAIPVERRAGDAPAPTLGTIFAGWTFVRRNPAILGTISLDLFAVLLGGATTLLPIYARDILHTGAWGLGVLRAAPAAGALLMTLVLSHYTIERRVGMRMFQAVIVFGLATLVFAVSRSMWLSILALAILGAADTISMVIRISLVQLATPDEMRGRVGAVNFLFVNASYQLGGFESGLTAALFGAVPAAVLGGIGTIAVALLWMKLFPALRDLERLE
ncbi:MAG TPA: MFS transporter [Stellaceae bacterium]|jgi:MFS family permease